MPDLAAQVSRFGQHPDCNNRKQQDQQPKHFRHSDALLKEQSQDAKDAHQLDSDKGGLPGLLVRFNAILADAGYGLNR